MNDDYLEWEELFKFPHRTEFIGEDGLTEGILNLEDRIIWWKDNRYTNIEQRFKVIKINKHELLYLTINSELQILRNRLENTTAPYLVDKYEQEIVLLKRMLEEAGLEEINA